MWIEFHDSVSEHEKTIALAQELGITRYAAGGLLAFLWSWAVTHAEMDGSIEDYTHIAISKRCHWDGEPAMLIAALQKTGFLDGMKIHNWARYAGKLIERRKKDRLRKQRHKTESPMEYSVGNSNGLPSTVTNTVTHTITPTVTTTSSSSSPRAREVIEYFRGRFPQSPVPTTQEIEKYLEQGMTTDAMTTMIDIVERMKPEKPRAYLLKAFNEKAKRKIFTRKQIEDDEEHTQQLKKSSIEKKREADAEEIADIRRKMVL